ncbi:MAG: BTAD domain-containing putative transcriptional regulator [Nocardioides sp.]|jgi:WD40 repeat protein/DNA-binding SARP family transcriptional activator
MVGLQGQPAATRSALGIQALGAVRVSRDGVEQKLGGGRQRRLLAVLLIHRDTVVSVDRIADIVFEGAPTDAAATTLRSYVARLRRTLESAVVTRSPGYQLDTAGLTIDVVDFEAGLQAGRAALQRQDPAGAVERLTAALALWHGAAYAEFADEPWAYPESQRLAELRLTAEELLIEAELACGHAEQVIPALEALCREHPLREAFRGQLMTAHYRAGRQADALAVLRGFRVELSEELGIDPSPALVELEQRILAQEPDLLSSVAVGEPLRGYRLGERLGTGLDGTVHAARLPGVDRDLVLKTLRPQIADDPEFIRTFEATAHRVASLRHPAVVPLHDWWREPGAAYVVMPRLPGVTLHDRLRRSSLGHREVVTLVERIGGALTLAADHGLVHGRVTVDNVLYDVAGEPVLTDFWLGGPSAPAPQDDVRAFTALVGQALVGSDTSPEVARVLGSPDGMTVEELTATLLTALGSHSHAPARGRNPYRGLRAFDEADAEDYFGRAELIDEVTERLSGSGLPSRLVLLVGASGTGKSSAVRAGLIPRVRAGGATGSESWFVATMLPGGAPYKELAESLRTIAVGDTAGLAAELAGVEGIDRALRRVVPEGGELLLVVDQFEELFTLSPESEQRAFLEGITHALTVQDSRLRVVATLRADYFDRPLEVQPFGSLVQDTTVTIPAMLPAEIEAAIVEPARRADRHVDRAVAAELVAALATEPAALPALQFVLFELAEHSPDGTLSLDAYRELGGIEGAIASRAEQLYLSLDDTDRGEVRELFENLVVVAAEGEPTRRRAPREELPVSAEVVDRWSAARLLTLNVDPQTREPTVEVAHEALVREWPRLRQWIEDDRNELILLGRIRESAATWAELGRDSSALLRGAVLEAALEITSRRSAWGPHEDEYVEASRRARDAEQAEQVDLIRRQGRTNRRLRLQLVGIGVALVVALVGGLVALDQREQAVREEHVAVARELAAAADANIRDDPERSILLALAAVDATRQHDEPVLPEALEALHRGAASARILRSFPGVGGAMDWSADGRLFVTEGPEESGILDIRNAVTGETVQKFRADKIDLSGVAFSPDSKRVVTAGDEGSVRVWDIATGRKVSDVTVASEGQPWRLSVSPDGRLVAASWLDGKVRVFPATGGKPWVIGGEPVWGISFSPDGRRLAMSSFDGEVRVVDLRSRREVLTFGRTFGIANIAWSPDGRRIALARPDGAAVHDARTGRLQLVTAGHLSDVLAVAWSPDSGRLATGSTDGTARVFAVDQNAAHEVVRLSAQDLRSGVASVAFSPDGEQLMTSDQTITSVKVWDVSDQAAPEVVNIPGSPDAECGAAITPDGRSVWVVESDGSIGRYDLATGRRQQRLPAPRSGASSLCLELSPDGALLATPTWWFPFPVWDTQTGKVAFVARGGREGAGSFAVDWDGSGARLAVSVTYERPGGPESHVRILDRTGAEVGRISGEPLVVIPSLDFRSDGDLVATTGHPPRDDPDRREIRLWDWRRDRLVRRIEGNTIGVEFDPSGALLASTRLIEGVVDVWDSGTGSRVSTLEGHTGIVTDLAFDADGERLATASDDGSVRVWDPRAGELQVTLRLAVPLGASTVEFSPDGQRLVTTWADGVTRVWTLDLDELVDIAGERVTRGLTDAECRQYLHTDTCPEG